jgi:hypothetical protein
MHREIRRPEAARGGPPGLKANAGGRHLQNRRVERVERRSVAPVQARGECGRVKDDVEASPVEKRA